MFSFFIKIELVFVYNVMIVKTTMDFRCKFVMRGEDPERVLFEMVKEHILNEVPHYITGIDRMEFQTRHYSLEDAGTVRVPIVLKFHTFIYDEAAVTYDIYMWVSSMIRRYGRDFGVDELSVDGQNIELLESYQVAQLETEEATPVEVVVI